MVPPAVASAMEPNRLSASVPMASGTRLARVVRVTSRIMPARSEAAAVVSSAGRGEGGNAGGGRAGAARPPPPPPPAPPPPPSPIPPPQRRVPQQNRLIHRQPHHQDHAD